MIYNVYRNIVLSSQNQDFGCHNIWVKYFQIKAQKSSKRDSNCDYPVYCPFSPIFSMNVKDYQRDSTVYFHQLGLADFTGETSDGWKMSTFADIRKHFHHEGVGKGR